MPAHALEIARCFELTTGEVERRVRDKDLALRGIDASLGDVEVDPMRCIHAWITADALARLEGTEVVIGDVVRHADTPRSQTLDDGRAPAAIR